MDLFILIKELQIVIRHKEVHSAIAGCDLNVNVTSINIVELFFVNMQLEDLVSGVEI